MIEHIEMSFWFWTLLQLPPFVPKQVSFNKELFEKQLGPRNLDDAFFWTKQVALFSLGTVGDYLQNIMLLGPNLYAQKCENEDEREIFKTLVMFFPEKKILHSLKLTANAPENRPGRERRYE